MLLGGEAELMVEVAAREGSKDGQIQGEKSHEFRDEETHKTEGREEN